ncbi:MAG: SRPBCC family protein [Anaerolineales bacterium]|nr:SRPBCC family protein [Anaerolineales bacterium]
MPIFEYAFEVRAPLAAVAQFHRDTRALKRLSPPPLVVQLHRVDPLAEGAVAEFTLWLGPLPLRWTAIHTAVDPLHGFTDTQTRGPLQRWRHTHRFTAAGPQTTLVTEHIEFEHRPGPAGWLTRVLFAPLSLRFLFAYRRWVTRRAVEGR